MKHKISVFALIVSLCFSGCSSIRMKYESKVKTDDKKISKYAFEKSYSLDPIPFWCAVTGIFFGGACWYYTVMPTTNHVKDVRADAKERLGEIMGEKEYTVEKEKISKSEKKL